MNISVIMATYNGEEYISDQLKSIICQLKNNDELIISDDGSTDCTVEIATGFLDENIKIVHGNHTGVANNFTNALSYAKNEIVLFSDQDDIWTKNKLEIIRAFFVENKSIKLIMHNAGYINSEGIITPSDIFTRRKSRHGYLRNVLYSTYYGCCMGVLRDYLLSLMPVPKNVMYDQYIGACAEKDSVSAFLDEILVYHRYHSGNWSRKQSPIQQIMIRLKLMYATFRRRKV